MSAKVNVYAYITDPQANIRNAPNGKVVTTLTDNGGGYVVTLLKVSNGWWKIDSTIEQCGDNDTEINLKGSSNGYWVHNSVIGFTGVGDGTAVLYSKPNYKSRKLGQSAELLHPIGVQGKWVKVKTADGKYTGWIHTDKICFNPLTTCP